MELMLISPWKICQRYSYFVRLNHCNAITAYNSRKEWLRTNYRIEVYVLVNHIWIYQDLQQYTNSLCQYLHHLIAADLPFHWSWKSSPTFCKVKIRERGGKDGCQSIMRMIQAFNIMSRAVEELITISVDERIIVARVML
jgi:hypothetical protein